MDLPSLRRDALAFQLVSPVRADAVFAARALVGERGAHAAEAVHRALEEFAPGGLVRDAGDLLACIELRALVDEHFGPQRGAAWGGWCPRGTTASHNPVGPMLGPFFLAY